jgi:predicted ArsR family transcriptional regulator
VAEARRATPEASLADLAERLGAHRSAVQRALERLERLATDTGDDTARRGRPARHFAPRPARPPRPGRPALA